MTQIRRYSVNTKQLCKMLGITRMTLYSWEKRGIFTAPRFGVRGDRRFTPKQAREITDAFGPNGKKYWHFKG